MPKKPCNNMLKSLPQARHALWQEVKKMYNFMGNSLQESPIISEKRCVSCHKPFMPQKIEHVHVILNTCVHSYLCPTCAQSLSPINTTRCSLCGYIMYGIQSNTDQMLCLRCLHKAPPWDGLSYYGLYESHLKELILRYKYNTDFSLIPFFNHCLSVAYTQMFRESENTCHILIPMPRHIKRLGAEGFNQMLELSRPLSERLAIPLHLHALERSSYRPPQVTLNASKRRKNPAQSFFAHADVAGKNVLLVDDVMTTGATLHHATLALQAAKTQSVHIILIAKVAQEMD